MIPSPEELFQSAARLQQLVPDAVLVGGSAAVFYANHRYSVDHDHVVQHLAERYVHVLQAVESCPAWHTSPSASRPPMTLMGSMGDIQAGIRNLRRSKPLEFEVYTLPSGLSLRVPTLPETARVKIYLLITRRSFRDFLDVIALLDLMTPAQVVYTFRTLDQYYSVDQSEGNDLLNKLRTILTTRNFKDSNRIKLATYKGIKHPYNKMQYLNNRSRYYVGLISYALSHVS